MVGFLEEWIAGSPLEGHIKVTTVAHSEDDITDDLNRLQSTYCLPGIVSSVVLVRENRGQVGVRDVAGFLAAAAAAESRYRRRSPSSRTTPDRTRPSTRCVNRSPVPAAGCSSQFTLPPGTTPPSRTGSPGTTRSCEPQIPATTVAWGRAFCGLGDRDAR